MTHAEREFTEFMDKVRDRARKSDAWLRRNRHIPSPAETRQANYDQETERLLAAMHDQQRRKTA